jgi:hypothetical protein
MRGISPLIGTLIELLGLPWGAAAIYAGWSGTYFLAAALVPIGIILYGCMRVTVVLASLQRGRIQTLVWLVVTQSITVAILYGVGAGMKGLFS